MQPWKILTKLLLITILALSASGVVSAKVASGPQNLGPGLHQGETAFNPLTHLAKIDVSTTLTPGSPVVTKKVPNPHGSRGGPAHTSTIERRIDKLKGQGHEHLGGGNLPEEVVKTYGGCKSCRRPDITTRAPDGTIYRENVGRSTGSGNPIARERRALDDIEAATGQRPGYTPYDR